MVVYKCIHCDFESEEPGKCPKCGVPLVAKPVHESHVGCKGKPLQ